MKRVKSVTFLPLFKEVYKYVAVYASPLVTHGHQIKDLAALVISSHISFQKHITLVVFIKMGITQVPWDLLSHNCQTIIVTAPPQGVCYNKLSIFKRLLLSYTTLMQKKKKLEDFSMYMADFKVNVHKISVSLNNCVHSLIHNF